MVPEEISLALTFFCTHLRQVSSTICGVILILPTIEKTKNNVNLLSKKVKKTKKIKFCYELFKMNVEEFEVISKADDLLDETE